MMNSLMNWRKACRGEQEIGLEDSLNEGQVELAIDNKISASALSGSLLPH